MLMTTLLQQSLSTVLFIGLVAINTAIAQDESPPNFLLLIGDDMGVETLGCYGIGVSRVGAAAIEQARGDNIYSYAPRRPE